MSAAGSDNEICSLRIERCDSDLRKWRQVEVPTSIMLQALHEVIQAAMGWLDDHLWEFTAGSPRSGLPMTRIEALSRASRSVRSACATCWRRPRRS